MVVTPLKLSLVGKMMLRCLKMPLRSQLYSNMTPTWPSLGPPEGQSDLYFTMFFEHFMFRFFIVLRGLMSPHKVQLGPNISPTWAPRGPKNRPKSASQIDLGTPFFGFDVGRPWKTDLGAIWEPSWGHLGPILGASGAILGASGVKRKT